MKYSLVAKIMISLLLVGICVFPFTSQQVLASDPFGSQQAFLDFLQKMGVPTYVNGKAANYEYYKRFNMIVYGTPQDVPDNDIYKGEYRYLGYTQYGGLFPNPDFPVEPGSSGPITEWGPWVDVSGAKESWNSFSNYPRTYNENAILYGHENENTLKYTAKEIGFEHAKLISPATAMSEGMVYTRFINKYGYNRYATFRIPKLTITINGSITTDKNTYIIESDKTSVTVKATTNVSLTLSSGLVTNDISKLIAEIEGTEKSGSKITSMSVSKDIVLSRAQYAPGTYTVTITGSGSYATTFRDADKKVFTKTITLVVKPAKPTINGSITTDQSTYVIDPDETSVTVKATANVSLTLSNGLTANNISNLTAEVEGTTRSGSKITSISASKDIVLSRTQYAPGTYTITINGSGSYTTTYGDTEKKTFTKTVTLVVKPANTNASLTGSLTIAPASAEFSGQDVTVKVLVNGQLDNYIDSGNIDHWEFSIQETTLPKTDKQTVSVSQVNASKEFVFVIPKEFLTGKNSHTLLFSASPKVVFKNPIYINNTAYSSLSITLQGQMTITRSNRAPVALFEISPNPLIISNTLTVTDKSYDPDGDPIKQRTWIVEKDGVQIYSGSSCPTKFDTFGVGNYKITLKVLDNPPVGSALWSTPYSVSLNVVADNQKPVARFTISPNPAFVDEPITYNDTSYDPEGKPLATRVWTVKCLETGESYQYVNQLPPSVFENTGWGINHDGVGTYQISLKVLDISPNGIASAKWSDTVSQTLVVKDPLQIKGLVMTNIISPPLGTSVPVVYPVSSPVRIKAGYRMTFNVNTSSGDRVVSY